jgi:putative hydrolase of the HAD superfamily
MLIGIYDYAEELVLEAKKYAQIALLSNINHIHYSAIQKECSSLFSLFDFTFFSFHVKMRKPHNDIFKYALETVNAKPESILFLDDTPANIKAAQSFGIDARLIIPDTKWHVDIMQEFTRY